MGTQSQKIMYWWLIRLGMGALYLCTLGACSTSQPAWKTKGRCHPEVDDRIFDRDDYRETWSCWDRNRLRQLKRWHRHRPHGLTESWHRSGKKRCRINYVHGDKEGLVRCWYESGRIARKANYHRGRKHGTLTVWYKNGKKRYLHTYLRGRRHGLNEGWYRNGQKRYRLIYKRGKPHGYGARWFPSGQLRSKGEFHRGRRKGTHRHWHKNGKPRAVHHYKLARRRRRGARRARYRRMRHGRSQRWDKQGRITFDCNYKNGRRHGRCLSNGSKQKIKCTRHYKRGLRHGVTRCVQPATGRAYQGTHKENQRDGTWQGWYSKKQRRYQVRYIEDEPDGYWRSWHPNGKPWREEKWQRGLAHGIWRVWHRNGQLAEQTAYKKGYPCGPHQAWDATGKSIPRKPHPPCLQRKQSQAQITLSLLIDTSGSMAGRRIRHARIAALRLVRHIPAHVQLQIIQFTHRPFALLSLGKMTPLKRQRAERDIKALRANGGTRLVSGLQFALENIERSRRKGPSLVLMLTDGQDSRRRLESAILALRRQGSIVSTFALGYGSAQGLLYDCARWGGGTFYKAHPPHRLHQGIKLELAKLGLHLPWVQSRISIGYLPFLFLSKGGLSQVGKTKGQPSKTKRTKAKPSTTHPLFRGGFFR